MLIVYALVRSGHSLPEGLTGIGETAGPVRLLEADGVTAAVSEIGDQTLHDGDAVAYLEVLRSLMPGGPVLPVRFGTLAPNEDAVRSEVLAPLRELSAAKLDQLEDLVEIQLKLSADQDTELRELLAASPTLRRLVETVRRGATDLGTRISVGEQVSEGLADKRAALDAHVADRLKPFTINHGSRTGDDPTVLTQYYLVRTDQLQRFDAAVQDLLEDIGGRYAVEYVGPLPPLDFAGDQNYEAPPQPNESGSRWGW